MGAAVVPEINLTPQFAQRIAGALPGRRTVIMHSRLAPGAAAALADGGRWRGRPRARTRLAVRPDAAARLDRNDEEHDPSFTAGRRSLPRRDAAIWRPATQRADRAGARRRRSSRSCMHSGSTTAGCCPVAPSGRGFRRSSRPNSDAAALEGLGAALQEAIGMRLARRESR
jgi:hypothetical protein